MKNYYVRALAIQLDGETTDLLALHRDLKAQRVLTTDYTGVAEQLLDSTTALYSVVFDLVSTIWNINRPADHPLKSFPPTDEPLIAGTIRRRMELSSVMFILETMSPEERQELFAKLSQKTQAEGS